MKKIATLLLAAGLLFSAAGMAQAIDFKIRGQWIMAFDYGEHGAFTGGNGMTGYKKGNEDNFEARQRLRLQLDAVASESLAGSIIFEMGDQIWGQSATGGALGADGTVVEVKNAWLDWMVPDTDIKVRMGLQGIALPSMTTGSQVWCDDAAGITASWQINENVALTGLWARLYNDNFQGYGDDGRRRNYMDNVDVAALLLPLTFDGFRLTPWAMYAGIGPNSLNGDRVSDWRSIGVSGGQYRAGMLPAGGAAHNSRMDLYGNAFWAGLTGELTLLDPWRIAWDLNYGSVSYDDGSANRAGWLASLLVEYDLGWTKPGLYGWYTSGDDDDRGNAWPTTITPGRTMPSTATSISPVKAWWATAWRAPGAWACSCVTSTSSKTCTRPSASTSSAAPTTPAWPGGCPRRGWRPMPAPCPGRPAWTACT